MEKWKKIDEFDGYFVSNKGRIKGIKVLKPLETNCGYFRVCLYKNGKKCYRLIHRLVADAFIPNLDNFPCVNHKDEDKSNNSVENLEWCDYQYNNIYNNRHVHCGEKISESKKGKSGSSTKKRIVLQFNSDGVLINKFESTQDASRKTLYSQSSICTACLNNREYKGYVWKYANQF